MTQWPDPEGALAGFLARFDPDIEADGRETMRRMRERLPGAQAMVYDNYNGLVMGFSPTQRPSDAVLSVLVVADHVTLCFLKGARIDDPDGLLKGSGSTVRHIRLTAPSDLDEPRISRLVALAIAAATPPFGDAANGALTIRSVSAKQRRRTRL